MRTNDSETRAIENPGGRTHHQGGGCLARAPDMETFSNMWPQEFTVGSERPRKASADSERIAPGTVRARLTYVSETMFGKMCRVIIRPGPAPAALAASTNGLSLRLRTWDRTIRATPIHPKTPMTMMRFQILAPRTATSTISS